MALPDYPGVAGATEGIALMVDIVRKGELDTRQAEAAKAGYVIGGYVLKLVMGEPGPNVVGAIDPCPESVALAEVERLVAEEIARTPDMPLVVGSGVSPTVMAIILAIVKALLAALLKK